ncbi:MAG TPA: YCF48-related protein [Chitinophagales bacterium]|nr:YCF48-related protein [Chitinophagales bacterium]
MKIEFVILLFLTTLVFSCRKEPSLPANPFVFPKTDSLPFENGHLKIDLVTSHAPAEISRIDFIDQNTGCAIDDRGKIFRTNDGGLNWTTSYSSPKTGYYDSDLEFVNESIGVAVISINSSDHETWILKTSNAGNSWSEIALPGFQLSSLTLIDSLHFLATGNGIVFRSSDGGAIWVVADSTHGIIRVSHNNTYFFGCNAEGEIFRSNDYGATWNEVAAISGVNYLSHLSFFESAGYINCFDTISFTVDDGVTWQKTSLPDSLYTLFGNSINALSSSDCLFFASWGFLNYDYFVTWAAVLQTLDGGLTFEKAVTFRSIGPLVSASFYDDKNGYAIDFNGNLLHVTVK